MTKNCPDPSRTLKIDGLEEVQVRLRTHPGYVEHLRLQAFGLTLNAVFRTNLLILLRLLRAAATDANLQMQLIQNVARPDVRDGFNATVITSLHNYVASTMTLVDHSRRLMADRTGELKREHDAKKTELLAHPEVRFIQELRNFMLHRSLPFLGHTYKMSDLNTAEPKVDMQIELGVKELLEWDGWTAGPRGYMATCEDDKLQLLPLIEKHGDLIFRFNAWIINTLAEANSEALGEANEIIVERNAILGGLDTDAARRLTDRVTRQREQVPWPPPADEAPFGRKLTDISLDPPEDGSDDVEESSADT
jgi:hypothetical protein